MRKTSLYFAVLLILSMLSPQGAEAFFSKREEPKENKSSPAGQKDSTGQPFVDVGSGENVDRLSDEEAEELKTYVEEVQQHVQQSQDGTTAAKLSSEAQTVKAAMSAENPGLEDYETVRSLEPIQNAGAVDTLDAVQATEPLNQVRRIQNASNQARTARAATQRPAA